MHFPHGAVGWSAVCDYGMSWQYSFIFLSCVFNDKNIDRLGTFIRVDSILFLSKIHYL